MVLLHAIGQPRRVFTRAGYLAVAAIAITALAFSPALVELISRWLDQEEYSHGFLIPIVSLCLLWARRHAIKERIGRPMWCGPLLILAAVAMNVLGQLSGAFVLSWIGFVVSLFGIVLACGGYPLLRMTFFPLIFLAFAMPLPSSLNSALTLQLQLISSELGAFFIRSVGVPVYLDGNVIDLGTYKLLVAEACSGLRYLFPLLSLSFLAAYLFNGPLWQRALIFLSSIPIAIGMNGFRIGMLGVLVDYGGPGLAEGALHLFEGWAVFVACGALLLAEMHLLAISSGKSFFRVCHLPIVRFAPPPRVKQLERIRPLVVCCGLLLLGALAVRTVHSEAVEARNSFVGFPDFVGQWHGRLLPLDEATQSVLRADDYILADFTSADNETVNLFVAYYASLSARKSLHSPSDCIPAGGWVILDEKVIKQAHPVHRVVVEKAGKRLLVYYWFDEQGVDVANEYSANVHRLLNSIVKRRADAALVRLVAEIAPDDSEVSADNRLQSFMEAIRPALTKYLPSPL